MKKSLYVLGATTFCLLSFPALCEVEEVYVYGTPNLSLGNSDIGGMSNYQIQNIQHSQNVADGRSMYEQIMKERKAAERQQCKTKMVNDQNSCNERARMSNGVVSTGCTIVKWTAIPVATASAWAGVEGEGAGVVILGSAAAALYQVGESCQTSADREYTADLAYCGVKQLSDEIKCDAIK